MTKRELIAKGRSATLDDLKALDPSVTCLTPEPVAAIMGVSAQWLRIKAREAPQDLGFGVCVLNSRIYIPVSGLIKFLEGKKEFLAGYADGVAAMAAKQASDKNSSDNQ